MTEQKIPLRTVLSEINPGVPLLTVYGEQSRMEFSAATLVNWMAKVSNLLQAELGLSEGDAILIDAPFHWSNVMLALGAHDAGITVKTPCEGEHSTEHSSAVFTTADTSHKYPMADVFILSDDPFGRGVEECGKELELGDTDYAPLVRIQADAFLYPAHLTGVQDNVHQAYMFLPAQRYACAEADSSTQSATLSSVLEFLYAGKGIVVFPAQTPPEEQSRIATAEKATLLMDIPALND